MIVRCYIIYNFLNVCDIKKYRINNYNLDLVKLIVMSFKNMFVLLRLKWGF